MTTQALLDAAEEPFAGDRGILAMDESIVTCDRRFAAAGIEQETESRRAYRELLVTTPRLAESIRGAILYDETIRQRTQRVTLEAVILKPNMVLPGSGCAERLSAEEVADATLACLLGAVPAALPGIAFISGGQAGELASARLNAMNLRSRACVPWALGFSFGRAIQQPALEIWYGEDANVRAAQQALHDRARCNQMARRGEYSAAAERTAA